jgi:hypothetical protein
VCSIRKTRRPASVSQRAHKGPAPSATECTCTSRTWTWTEDGCDLLTSEAITHARHTWRPSFSAKFQLASASCIGPPASSLRRDRPLLCALLLVLSRFRTAGRMQCSCARVSSAASPVRHAHATLSRRGPWYSSPHLLFYLPSGFGKEKKKDPIDAAKTTAYRPSQPPTVLRQGGKDLLLDHASATARSMPLSKFQSFLF